MKNKEMAQRVTYARSGNSGAFPSREHGIELRHLRYVIAAAEQGSFRRAAEVMGVRVSTMSRCVRDLEDRIGAALFIRRSHGVKLTFAGEHFFARARRVMTDVGKAIREAGIAGTGREGIVRIGLLSSLAAGFPAVLTKIYRAAYTDVRIVYIEGGTADHVPAVQQHRLDVAFLPHPMVAELCDSIGLWDERVFVAMAQNDVLANRETVEWKDLRGRHFIFSEAPPGPEIQDRLTERLVELGLRPSVELLAVYRDTLMQIIATNSELTLVGEARVAAQVRGVVCRPIAGENLAFHAVWLPTNDNPAFRRFLSLAKVLSKRCAECVFKSGLAGPSDEKDEAEQADNDLDAERISRLAKVVSRRCAACLVRHAMVD